MDSQIYLPQSEKLNIGYLSHAFDNKSECYKLFWFQAIIRKVAAGQTEITFDELVDDMIADAWYMVTEYHLNLGPRDNLEAAVNYIYNLRGFRPSEKKEVILDFLQNTDDPEVLRYKRILISNVPYRLQSPFMQTDTAFWNAGQKKLAEKINQFDHLIYYFEKINGLGSIIIVQEAWADYIIANQLILEGWLKCDMIEYLQKRNPSVPGISDKIEPPQERKLADVQKYWKLLISIRDIHEIYDNKELHKNDISIDHFVPWSYVAHDEFWNLHPTTRSINSSKSNNLPEWDAYFKSYADLEFMSYQMMWKNEALHTQFDKCSREHLNNADIRQRLYRQGLSQSEFETQLENVIRPVYESALQCGFRQWVYKEDAHERND